jgi:glutamine synthetase
MPTTFREPPMTTKERPLAPPDASSASTTFGRHTFNLDAMQKRLPRPVFEAIQATIRAGEPLDVGLADVVAGAMKDWAVEQGATHFTHWFQPLTGATAEKHDAFLSTADGVPIESFTGAQLIQAEPDASSFPSGGMRSTFEARGYTAWDPTSPAFLVFHEGTATLTIPSVFVSYTGEALDKKTPLLRSMRELSRAAVKSLRLMGREASRVVPTLGAEQEFFLVARRFYDHRPDLQVTGRTVMGAAPPKGQQLEDHYFGAIDEVALEYIAEVEVEAWKLGIPVKTRHNEVAPHQYEMAPHFGLAHVATDQNQILMELMRRVARRRNLAVLFHEKPFEGVNGSGKHSNWSLADDQGRNLLEPGRDPHANVEFLYFLAAVLKAVHRRARLLRAGIASAGNDHRLGANEAPPAIISAFLGDSLTEILETLAQGKTAAAVQARVIGTGLEILPRLQRDNTDRNRTSPFAFTGNKFEFRAVGAGQSIAMPLTYLNVAVAESLDELNAKLEARLKAGEERDVALLGVVREAYVAARSIVFNGNNYSEEWVAEARRRGLPNDRDTPAALTVFEDDDVAAFLDRYGVFQPHELKARHRIVIERYCRFLKVEANQMVRMAETCVLPTAVGQQEALARSLDAIVGLGLSSGPQREALEAYAAHVDAALLGVKAVQEALVGAPDDEHSPTHARWLCDHLRPAMRRLRDACDALERRTDADAWPLPTYHQLLFQ